MNNMGSLAAKDKNMRSSSSLVTLCRTYGNTPVTPLSHVSSHLYTLHFRFDVGAFDACRLAFHLIRASHKFRTEMPINKKKIVNTTVHRAIKFYAY